MSDTITPSTSKWFHEFYDQTIYGKAASSSSCSSSSFGFSSDSTLVTATTGNCASDSLLLSPSCSTIASAGPLTPKGNVSKPIRRRSRASKKTPITLLNANTSNFRSLVQQFTGCSRSPTSFGARKGPINLNFQLGSIQNQGVETTAMAPYINSYSQYYQMQQVEQQEQHNHPQLLHQDHQYMVPFEDVYNFQGAGDNDITASRAYIETPEELLMDDISLHELAREALSNANIDDNYF